jgi:hypothetical protein
MAKKRSNIPPDIKQALVKEAGMKCANPGCTNYRTHLHHIYEWHIYQTHNKDHMIAVCPSCHDEIHYGRGITDKVLYHWKGIRKHKNNRDNIYIEPGYHSKLLLGTVAFTSGSGFIVFELSKNNKLEFRLIEEDIFILNLKISTLAGLEVVRVVNNHIKYTDNELVIYERRSGKYSLKAPLSEEFISTWALTRFREKCDQNYAIDGKVTLLDLEVIEPGLVKVQGVWADNKSAVIVDENFMSLDSLKFKYPVALCGEGPNSVLIYTNSVNVPLFGFDI